MSYKLPKENLKRLLDNNQKYLLVGFYNPSQTSYQVQIKLGFGDNDSEGSGGNDSQYQIGMIVMIVIFTVIGFVIFVACCKVC